MRTVITAFLRYLTRRRSLVVLQLLGIAFGVAAVIGMTLSARAALDSFREAVDFLRGTGTHTLERIAGPLAETIIPDLVADPAVTAFSPVIDRRLKLENGDSVRLLGVDPLLDRTLRPAVMQRWEPGAGQDLRQILLRFLTDPRAVAVDADLARRMGIKPGDTISTSRGEFHLIAVFPNPSGEPLILLDIAHAQSLFEIWGQVDRIDLILRDEAGFRSRFGQGYAVQSARQRQEALTGLLGAFRLNLQALSLLALFVGVFLVYNTAMFAVVTRRRDAGILRSLGVFRFELAAAFLVEILLLGLLGGVAGGVMGDGLSRLLTDLVGATISDLYFSLQPKPQPWSLKPAAMGALLGVAACLLGSAAPLVELMRVEPAVALRGRVVRRDAGRRAVRMAWIGLLLFAVSGGLFWGASRQVYLGFAGVLTFLLGVCLCSGLLILWVVPLFRRSRTGRRWLVGRIALGNIRANLSRTAVAVSAFTVALAMSIGLGTMIGSFRLSLIDWMNGQLRGDLYVASDTETDMPEDVYERIRRLPGVAGVDPYRNVPVAYGDATVYLTAVNAVDLKRFSRFRWMAGGDEHWDAVKEGAVIVSESFFRRFRLGGGDAVNLTTPRGAVSLPIAAVFYDYTSEHGVVMMDRETYLRLFNDRTINSLGVFLITSEPGRSRAVAAIRVLAEERRLPVATREDLHRRVLKIFDQTFAVTRSMRLLAIIVAIFGIAGALMTLFVERQGEFGIYRALGFTSHQIAAMTLCEGMGMGGISLALSAAVGTALSAVIIGVINLHSFHWTVFYHFLWEPYALALGTTILAGLAASSYPLWKVYRTYPHLQIREE